MLSTVLLSLAPILTLVAAYGDPCDNRVFSRAGKFYQPTIDQCMMICCAPGQTHAYRDRCFYQCKALDIAADATVW